MQIDVTNLKKAIDANEDFILLDVRTNQEFEKGKIKGSINLPVDEITNRIEEIIPDKSKKIYVYCLSGSRSNLAVNEMVKLKYLNVFDVKNGLLAWRANNFPTV